jgi:phage protein D
MGRVNILVEINGRETSGLLQAAITSTNRFAADAYSLTFALGSPPLSDLSFWSSLSSGSVEIFAGCSPAGATTGLITGMIDSLQIDAVRGTAAIEGRDLSSSLVDSYRQGDFVNQTASEVVAAIANRHGLSATVSPTSGLIGRYYGDGYTRLSTGQFSKLRSDWDLVVQLARENGFDAFVQGNGLFFQPSSTTPATIIPLTPGLVQNLRFERTLSITEDATARVQTWNSQNMASYDSGANQSSGSANSSTVSSNQPYLFSTSNFTSAQVTQAAARYSAEVSRLQTTLLAEMPWDLRMTPRTGLMITGTMSSFDGPYLIDSVDRHHSSTSGSKQTIRAISVVGSN